MAVLINWSLNKKKIMIAQYIFQYNNSTFWPHCGQILPKRIMIWTTSEYTHTFHYFLLNGVREESINSQYIPIYNVDPHHPDRGFNFCYIVKITTPCLNKIVVQHYPSGWWFWETCINSSWGSSIQVSAFSGQMVFDKKIFKFPPGFQ